MRKLFPADSRPATTPPPPPPEGEGNRKKPPPCLPPRGRENLVFQGERRLTGLADHRQRAAAGVETAGLLPVVLAEPEVEADRQDDQICQDARHQQDARGQLLVEQGCRVEGGRREPQDEPEDADLG